MNWKFWRREPEPYPLLEAISGFDLHTVQTYTRRKLVRVTVTDPRGNPVLDVTHPVVVGLSAESFYGNGIQAENMYRVKVSITDEPPEVSGADMESGDEG